MERGSDKHSPRLDDAMAHETEGLVRGGHETRAEQWRSPEPAGEDQPTPDLDPAGPRHGGVPGEMSERDVEGRAELASYLGRAGYPTTAADLLARARAATAPDRVLAALASLPAGRSYRGVGEVWGDLGGHTEGDRFPPTGGRPAG